MYGGMLELHFGSQYVHTGNVCMKHMYGQEACWSYTPLTETIFLGHYWVTTGSLLGLMPLDLGPYAWVTTGSLLGHYWNKTIPVVTQKKVGKFGHGGAICSVHTNCPSSDPALTLAVYQFPHFLSSSDPGVHRYCPSSGPVLTQVLSQYWPSTDPGFISVEAPSTDPGVVPVVVQY